MDTVEVPQHLLVEGCQFLIDSHNTVRFALVAPLPVRTPLAAFALVIFLGSTVLVPLYRSCLQEMKPLPIWAYHKAILVNGKIAGPVGVIAVALVFRFLLVHGEFHKLFHGLFFAVKIVIETSVTSIGYRILRIKAISFMESVHQWLEAVHV